MLHHVILIHLKLLFPFQVAQWMVGIKRLIQEARNVEAPLSPTDRTIADPFISDNAEKLTSNHPIPQLDCPMPGNTLQENSINAEKHVQLTDSVNMVETTNSSVLPHRQSNSPATIETTMIQ